MQHGQSALCQRPAAAQAPCAAACNGLRMRHLSRTFRADSDEPSDAQHPLSFVVDEIKPVSKWRQFGYPSARAAAEDWSNLQAAHWFCNAQKGNKTAENGPKQAKIVRIPHVSDGSW